MATRGRPTILKDRTNTSISLSHDDLEFIRSFGKDNSVVIRELIAEKRKSVESPVGKLKQEIAERKKNVQDELLLIEMLETRLMEEKEKEAQKLQEIDEIEEKNAKIKEDILSKFDYIVRHPTPRLFLEYLVSGYGLQDIHAARQCVFDTLVGAGHTVENVNKIPMMKCV